MMKKIVCLALVAVIALSVLPLTSLFGHTNGALAISTGADTGGYKAAHTHSRATRTDIVYRKGGLCGDYFTVTYCPVCGTVFSRVFKYTEVTRV
ncbi:hypothetical protein AGMMS49992_33520 [Clostridia bacterium]|nr:hypothetical protein AGMMS49992_33520 [Clostridia bacterium]